MDGMTGDEAKEKEAYLAYVRKMYGFYGFGLWTVAQKVTGNVIGRCGLSLPSEECDCLRAAFEKNQRSPGTEEPCLELGYLIGKKYQRQGYGLEAGREVLRYAFDRLGCQSDTRSSIMTTDPPQAWPESWDFPGWGREKKKETGWICGGCGLIKKYRMQEELFSRGGEFLFMFTAKTPVDSGKILQYYIDNLYIDYLYNRADAICRFS